jgi:lysozyme
MIERDFSELCERIKFAEGFREKPYLCSEGVPTFGYGFTYITEYESEWILRRRVRECISLIDGYIENEEISLDEFRRKILYEMAFQLGFKGVLKFKRMWKAIRDFDYEVASQEMLNSKWHVQTPSRCEYLAKKMREGV